MGILSVNPNNISLDDTNYEEDDRDAIVLIRLLVWHKFDWYKWLNLNNAKNLKKDKWRINANSVAS